MSSTRNFEIDEEEIRSGPVLLGESKYFGYSEDCDQVLIFNRNYILNGPTVIAVIGLNERLRYEVPGVCDARILYEITITKS